MSPTTKEILLVEDDPQSVLLTTKMLENGGYKVTNLKSAEAALDWCQDHVPHLVILDMNLQDPDKNGLYFLKEKTRKSNLKKVPVIVLSGLSDKKIIYSAFSLGATDYLTKPVRTATLLGKIRKALKSVEFHEVRYENDSRPKIQLFAKSRIRESTAVGFIIEAPVKLDERTDVEVHAPFLDSLQIKDEILRRTNRPSRSLNEGNYLNDIVVAGIDQETAKRIRKRSGDST